MGEPAPAPPQGNGKLGAWWSRLPGWEKGAVIAGAGLGAFFLYRWWKNRSASSNAAATTAASNPTTPADTGTGSGSGGSGGFPFWQTGAGNPSGFSGFNNGAPPSDTSSMTGLPSTPAFTPTGPNAIGVDLMSPAPVSSAKPATATPVGLSGATYGPNGSLTLPAGENLSTPVVVPNASAGNPVVPLSDLISTGSTNTLSSAYGTAASAAGASQSLNAPTAAKTTAKAAATPTKTPAKAPATPTPPRTTLGHATLTKG